MNGSLLYVNRSLLCHNGSLSLDNRVKYFSKVSAIMMFSKVNLVTSSLLKKKGPTAAAGAGGGGTGKKSSKYFWGSALSRKCLERALWQSASICAKRDVDIHALIHVSLVSLAYIHALCQRALSRHSVHEYVHWSTSLWCLWHIFMHFAKEHFRGTQCMNASKAPFGKVLEYVRWSSLSLSLSLFLSLSLSLESALWQSAWICALIHVSLVCKRVSVVYE